MVKPSKKKKKFIDKKNAVTFHLVHRSQKDPLAADDKAPQLVLHPVVTQTNEEKKGSDNKKEELRKFGVFFDDDYDYLQHLKDLSEFSVLEPVEKVRQPAIRDAASPKLEDMKLKLPSSVFASEFEESVGLLNKAAPLKGPQLDWDPDIVAALDEDFDFENPDNLLDDDFVTKANASNSDEDTQDKEEDADLDADDEYSSDNDSVTGESENHDEFFDKPFAFTEEETKSRFTEYSMSSSVLGRKEGLALLDSRFEKLYEQYDDEEIGSLDGEAVEGYRKLDSEFLEHVLKQYQSEVAKSKPKEGKDAVNNKIVADQLLSSSDDELVKMVVEDPTEKWDCESVLSTYSNLYNHPKLITEPRKVKPIKISHKTGIPVDALRKGLTKKLLESLDEKTSTKGSVESSIQSNNIPRIGNETPEQKRLRKREVRTQKKDRRVEKKANTLAFKEEKKKQEKVLANLRQNLQVIKLA